MRRDTRLLAEAYDSIFTPPKTEDIVINGKQRKLIKLDLEESHDLPSGVYQGLYYGYCLEINDKKFKTKTGVRCMREACGGAYPIVVQEDGSVWRVYEKSPDGERLVQCKVL